MSATSYPFRRALTASSTATSWATKIPTATEPVNSTSAGVFSLFDAANGLATNTYMPRFIHIVPYGTDTNNETFSFRLWGWTHTSRLEGASIWVPQLLLDVACVMGNIDGSALGTGIKMCDTLTLTQGDQNASLISPANDTTGSVLVHLHGVHKIEFDFNINSGSAVSMNALWRAMDQGR